MRGQMFLQITFQMSGDIINDPYTFSYKASEHRCLSYFLMQFWMKRKLFGQDSEWQNFSDSPKPHGYESSSRILRDFSE